MMLVAEHASAETVTGAAKARDATTIEIAGGRFRLDGIAPPEEGRTCGAEPCADIARDALQELVSKGDIACEKLRKLGHGFFLAHCKDGAGADIAIALIAAGWTAAESGATPAYVEAEAKAKAAGLGMWK